MNNALNNAAKFRSLSLAVSFAARSERRTAVMMGEGLYLVVTPANAAKLEKMGYEWLN